MLDEVEHITTHHSAPGPFHGEETKHSSEVKLNSGRQSRLGRNYRREQGKRLYNVASPLILSDGLVS